MQRVTGLVLDGLCLVAGAGLSALLSRLAFGAGYGPSVLFWAAKPAAALCAGAVSAFLDEGRLRRGIRVLLLEVGPLMMTAWALSELIFMGKPSVSLVLWVAPSIASVAAFAAGFHVAMRWGSTWRPR